MSNTLNEKVQLQLLRADNIISVNKGQRDGSGGTIIHFTLEGGLKGRAAVYEMYGAYFYIEGESAYWSGDSIVPYEVGHDQ